MRQGEAELDAAESGFSKLVKRVIPGLGNTGSPSSLTDPNETLNQP
jgi:hypothetical protein